MEYISTREAAEKWGVSIRCVQRFLADGRIPGAVRWGRSWAIPADVNKPEDPRRISEADKQIYPPVPFLTACVALPRGDADRAVELMQTEEERTQLEAELALWRGDFAAAIRLCENVPKNSPMKICATTVLLLAGFSTGDSDLVRKADGVLRDIRGTEDQNTARLALEMLRRCLLIREDKLTISAERFSALSIEIRPLVIYLHLKTLQANGEYARMVDVANTALTMMVRKDSYNLLEIYLMLLCAVGYIGLDDPETAKRYISRALHAAMPDGIIMPVVESLAVGGGLIEECLDQEFPEMKDRILNKWDEVWENWLSFRNGYRKKAPVPMMPLREYQIALAIANGSTYEETADHFGLSLGRIRNLTSRIYSKLNVNSRAELKEIIG